MRYAPRFLARPKMSRRHSTAQCRASITTWQWRSDIVSVSPRDFHSLGNLLK
jgi:hypothetical protein